MNVIDPFMQEHRVIEQVVDIFDTEILNIHEQNPIDSIHMYMAIDFVCTYVDLTHHVKEEDFLFRELAKKDLLPDHARILHELLEEHKHVRTIIGKWTKDTNRFFKGEDTSQEITLHLKALKALFTVHIKKEDERFFNQILSYFTTAEQNEILGKIADFDKQVLHWKYRKVEKALRGSLWDENSLTGC